MRTQRDEPVFYHISEGVGRPGGTRVDLRRWGYAALALAFLGLAGWLYLEQATVAASYGASVRQLQDEKERLRREITSLRAEVAVAGSLERLTALAEQMGYTLPDATDASRRLVVTYEQPAVQAAPEAEPAGARAGATHEGSALGQRVQEWVSQLGEWLGAPAQPQPNR